MNLMRWHWRRWRARHYWWRALCLWWDDPSDLNTDRYQLTAHHLYEIDIDRP